MVQHSKDWLTNIILLVQVCCINIRNNIGELCLKLYITFIGLGAK
jgi:hypothetical protein